MTSRLLLLSALLATGCQATSGERAATTSDRRDGPASATRMTITLTDLTERPSPVGVPTRLEIDAPALPASGRVAVSWKALDGDTTAAPRDGVGELVVGEGDGTLTIALTAPARGAAAVLTLQGAIADRGVHGKFSDRLFATRAGRFDGSIQ